jgi:hypothetical protein
VTDALTSQPLSGPESVRRDTRLLLVSNDAMRARRRPLALLVYYLYQLAISLFVAWPIARGLGIAFGGHPRGDSVLFDDGGWALLALRTAWERASPAVSGLLLLAVVGGAVLGLVPVAAVLASLSHATPETRAPRPRHLAPYVVAAFRPLLILLAVGSALELALGAVGLWAFGATREALENRGAARADEIAVLAAGFVLLVVSIVVVLHDLARAAVVRYRTGAWPAVRAALKTLRHGTLRVWWSWAWRGLASLVLMGLVMWALPFFGSHGTKSLVAIALLHQVVVASRVALRTSWLARALRAVDAIKKS